MASTIPDARLLAVLRDPVDRAYSHYWMEHARERDPRTFEEAIADELAERPGAPARTTWREVGMSRQLDDVGARFPRTQLHVVLLDDLRDRPQETYADVCRFLGIDDRFVPPRLGERVNRYVEFRSMRMRRVRRSVALDVGDRTHRRPAQRPRRPLSADGPRHPG